MTTSPPISLPLLASASGKITLPGSKSISNRILLLAALAKGQTRIENLLLSDDTERMREALSKLGVEIQQINNHGETPPSFIVKGCQANFPVKAAELFMGNAGTAMRTLAAVLACLDGNYRLFGIARMHERPIGHLVDALRQVGSDISYQENDGFPPLLIKPCQFSSDSEHLVVSIRGDVSSQFLSGLLIALPLLKKAVTVRLISPLISRPYVAMTCALMRRFAVNIVDNSAEEFYISGNEAYLTPGDFFVEGDASSASYFLAAAAISGAINQDDSTVEVIGVGANSLQGDIGFANALAQMGASVSIKENSISVCGKALRGIKIDCNEIPDAAMTLAVVALFANGKTELNNIGSWRVKETDRISAMSCELAKLGAEVSNTSDSISVSASSKLFSPEPGIDTYDDHRMAMCFSLAAFAVPLSINDPQCVNKTFPEYFAKLQTISRCVQIITIDGPSASGKGTIAAIIADQLNFHYLDSGALYRVLAYSAKEQGLAWSDHLAISSLVSKLPVAFNRQQILLNGKDVSSFIRTDEISQGASIVAAIPEVRQRLLLLQRSFHCRPGLVADGRDMGNVVFPRADLKIYLDASSEVRGLRRYKQLKEFEKSVTLPDMISEMRKRDERDRARSVAPLLCPSDAIYLDSSDLSIEQVVAQILKLWHNKVT